MSELSINIGFWILGFIGIYLAVLIVKDVVMRPYAELKRHRDNAMTDYMNEQIKNLRLQAEINILKNKDEELRRLDFKERLLDANPAQLFWLQTQTSYNADKEQKLQKEMDTKKAIAEQFCDDLQRMKRLDEDSEKYQQDMGYKERELKLVK